jgi:N6-L-threonylcarbamoyladenine synthase
VNYVRKQPEAVTADVCASFQEAVVDVLVTKARRAAADTGARALCLGGGVAANSQLRERFLDACVEDGLHGFLPSREMCAQAARLLLAALRGETLPDVKFTPRLVVRQSTRQKTP